MSPELLRALRRLLPGLRSDPSNTANRSTGNLDDCRKVYFDVRTEIRPPGIRIVLRLLPDESAPEQVQIVSIGPRSNLEAYRRAAARLDR